ncbi:hypothetical protein KUCAC02_005660 [Chaenocephalus aceratus]|uniref:Uncharacterized protein n=1 Tax=Chaenocephalus aceratus TaxID=36190 RepID=A0ACB9WP77_CHAAC|nr:hypothetical protein KUCAC02_005660 [Chaenocephalus aceratus]
MKLLLLLAVAANQMELSASLVTLNAPGGNINISAVPITFYGKTYTWLHVKIGDKVEVCLKNDPSEDDIDCLVTNEMALTKLTYDIYIATFPPRGNLVHITTEGLGSVTLQFFINATARESDMELSFYNYGLQAACDTYPLTGRPFSDSLELSTKVGDRVMDTWTPPADDYFYRDVSGCRGSGGAVLPGSAMPNAEPCSVEVCSLSAVLANVTCGPEEFCQADNTCAIPPVVCTVTGSTVIGFHGAVHSVQDRCAYSLMQPEGSASFNLIAAFRERRRTDVPLLDHLILSLPGVTMYLERGGRVRVRQHVVVMGAQATLIVSC